MQRQFVRIWAFPSLLVLYELAIYLANDAYLPALPELQLTFKVSQDQIQETLMVWFIGSAAMQLVLGPVSDRVGRKPVLLGACLLFVAASAVCAVTDDYFVFLIARFIQGVCVCSIAVAGYAAIHELYDTHRAIQIIAIMGSITILAPALGPLVGAFIILASHWRVIFWLLALMATLSWVGLALYMVETRKAAEPIHFTKILKDYWKITTNKSFCIHAFTVGFCIMGFVAWIVESAFIIEQTYHRSKLEYGVIQFLIFGMIILGGHNVKYYMNAMSTQRMITLGLGFMAVAALGMLIMNECIQEHLYGSVAWMMVMSYFSAIAFGALNRGAIDAASEPMGSRMAIFSTWTSVFASLGTYVLTLFNDKTLDNLSWVVCLPMLLSFLLWIVGCLILPKK